MERMIALLKDLAPLEGYTLSGLDDVTFMRSNRPVKRTAVLYEPCICIVVQGRKRGFLADETFVFDAQQLLVLSVPLPFFSETEASEEVPLLALSIRIDRTTLAGLLMAVGDNLACGAAAPKSVMSTPMDGRLSDAVLRLLEALRSPLEARVLGPAIVNEICFRVLTGEQGNAMRAALTNQSQFGKITKALQRIHADCSANLNVPLLASEAAMSVAAFHLHFKAVTQCSPIQYVKSMRLHNARLLMIRHDMTAAAASAQVGYESASQFNREFKRLFGRTPGQETHVMRPSLSLRASGHEECI